MKKLSRTVLARIKKRPYYAFLYAKNILKGRLPPDLEDFLSKDAQSCYLYAKYVLKGRLPDSLHAALLIGEWEKSEAEYIKAYVKEFG
jgi:hypothetical protein